MICAAGGRVLRGVGGALCEVYCHHHKNLTHENKSKEIRLNHSQINKKGITQYPVN